MPVDLSAITDEAKRQYADLLAAGHPPEHWWTAIVITAGSQQQAERYEQELARRRERGHLPPGVATLVVADLADQRIGSGGATINALKSLLEQAAPDDPQAWWEGQRVLLIHGGGDSRRLPQYSLSGKLFSALPVRSAWGEPSTLLDEILTLSTPWTQRLSAGVVVLSGDVLLTFDAAQVTWDQPGVSGVAMRQPFEVGSKHGVYVLDEQGRVYAFLSKPTRTEAEEAGALLPDDQVAVDTGLLVFAPEAAGRLAALAVPLRADLQRPLIDLYHHITLALTGQYQPDAQAHPLLSELASSLHGLPFRCDLVEGQFTHIGTTRLFRHLMTEDTSFSRLYEGRQQLPRQPMAGVQSAGVIIDSVLGGGGEIGAGAVVIECHLQTPVHVGNGAILHGLADLSEAIEAPADLVVHQVPVQLDDGSRGVVLRVYGVADDPKEPLDSASCTWLGRPMAEVLQDLGMTVDEVWPGLPQHERTLWHARLFPVAAPAEAWEDARRQMGLAGSFTIERWRRLPRLSLAESTVLADTVALVEARARRREAQWESAAVALAEDGADIRPLLANAPAVVPVAAAGRTLLQRGETMLDQLPTEAASRFAQAHLLLAQAGLVEQAGQARRRAFAAVRQAVEAAAHDDPFGDSDEDWLTGQIEVTAPARMDFGGGWSDTPPFCLDWGGTVLDAAIKIDGQHPVQTTVRRIAEPVIRLRVGQRVLTLPCGRGDTPAHAQLPGSPFAIPQTAFEMLGIIRQGDDLRQQLQARGGGLEIVTDVALPVGSGLGASSILAATVVRALAELRHVRLTEQQLIDQVLRLEQRMTTGGGWQDQAGAIYPGTKLIHSGPGLRQVLRVNPVALTPERRQELADRFVLYDTGIQRVARGLLEQVVGRYLARETACVQILHSIKTLAWEMAYAMGEGDWAYLGQLMSRHHERNQQLVPATMNAPLQALLEDLRPYLAGSKLAGAGGGGFLMALCHDPAQAARLRAHLQARPGPGQVREWQLSNTGLEITSNPE